MSKQIQGDDRLVAIFKHMPKKNARRTAEEGRPVFDDEEVCELHAPGNKDWGVFPALGFSHWSSDQYGGEQVEVTYAERFEHQYRQFKAQQAQTISGTPLKEVPFLSEGRKAELRAQNLYTLEQLAAIEGQELKNLGPGGREMKNQAEAYMAETKANAPNLQLASELEQMRARNAILEEDMKALKAREEAKAEAADAEYDNMTLEQLQDMVTTQTGHPPRGSLPRKSLIRMLQENKTRAA